MNYNGYNIYKSNSINYSSKEQLLLMLVDGAVKFSKIGRQAILNKDIKTAHKSLIKTQDIFTELRTSLDISVGEWAVQIFEVYGFIHQKLVQTNIKKDINMLDEVIPLIEQIRDLWHEAYRKAKQ